jgi:hypothetical protein
MHFSRQIPSVEPSELATEELRSILAAVSASRSQGPTSSQSGINALTFATIRRCSACGGTGIIISSTFPLEMLRIDSLVPEAMLK